MAECPPEGPTSDSRPIRRLTRDEIAHELFVHYAVNPHPESIEVPKYPLRLHDDETITLGKADYAEFCWVLAPRVDSWSGITWEYGYQWEPDEAGRARLRQQIRKLLIEPGDFLGEDLEHWTMVQLLPPLTAARSQADGVLQAQQKAQLREPFELGLRYAPVGSSTSDKPLPSYGNTMSAACKDTKVCGRPSRKWLKRTWPRFGNATWTIYPGCSSFWAGNWRASLT